MTNFAWAVLILFMVSFSTILVYLIRKIGSAEKALPVSAEWIDELDRYRPMLRMLDNDDVSFLRAQPGFTPEMARNVRKQRTEIFRGYLGSLENDFNRVCLAIKLVMAQSQYDRPDLAEALIRQQVTFVCAMLSVRLHLVLYTYGLSKVDVSALVKIFDSMRMELRTMLPAQSAA